MSYKVFSLKDVPEIEANGVRQLLTQSEIKFCETPSTFVSDGAIWVYEETDIAKANQLIDKFEVEWQRHNMGTKHPVSKITSKKIFLNMLLWSAIAVVSIYVFESYFVP